MIECRSGAGFLLESLQTVSVSCEVRRKDLDRNFTVQSCVTGAINLAHATGADLGDDRVVRESGVDWDLCWGRFVQLFLVSLFKATETLLDLTNDLSYVTHLTVVKKLTKLGQ